MNGKVHKNGIYLSKSGDIEQIILLEGSDKPEEKIAAKHGAIPFFATYMATVGRYGGRFVAYTPILFLPSSAMPNLKTEASGWKKKIVQFNDFSEEKIIEKDDRRRMRDFANAFGNKKTKAEVEKMLGPD